MRDIVTKNKECSTSWAAVETCRQNEEGILSIIEKEKEYSYWSDTITLSEEVHGKVFNRRS